MTLPKLTVPLMQSNFWFQTPCGDGRCLHLRGLLRAASVRGRSEATLALLHQPQTPTEGATAAAHQGAIAHPQSPFRAN
jgi:hypothetical protein